MKAKIKKIGKLILILFFICSSFIYLNAAQDPKIVKILRGMEKEIKRSFKEMKDYKMKALKNIKRDQDWEYYSAVGLQVAKFFFEKAQKSKIVFDGYVDEIGKIIDKLPSDETNLEQFRVLVKIFVNYKKYIDETEAMFTSFLEEMENIRKTGRTLIQDEKTDKSQVIKKVIISALVLTPAVLILLYFYFKSKNQEFKKDLRTIKKLEDKIPLEEFDEIIEKRSSFVQKYLPNWLKGLFGINYDWEGFFKENKASIVGLAGAVATGPI